MNNRLEFIKNNIDINELTKREIIYVRQTMKSYGVPIKDIIGKDVNYDDIIIGKVVDATNKLTKDNYGWEYTELEIVYQISDNDMWENMKKDESIGASIFGSHYEEFAGLPNG
jgi:hypothetical protein